MNGYPDRNSLGLFRAVHGRGRVDIDDVAGNELVEEHAHRGQGCLTVGGEISA
jgi:hypothetical protein